MCFYNAQGLLFLAEYKVFEILLRWNSDFGLEFAASKKGGVKRKH